MPELASLTVAFVFSIFLPVNVLTANHKSIFSSIGLKGILFYQAPYLIGLLIAFGFVHLAGLALQAIRLKRDY